MQTNILEKKFNITSWFKKAFKLSVLEYAFTFRI